MDPLTDPHRRAALRWGWTLLALFLLGGLTLEFLHLIKAPWYFDVRIRRELWVLAHAHGALLAVLCILFALCAGHCLPEERKRALASRLLRWGAALVPAGFFLGGIGNSESDPSPAIVLTPAGALMALHAVAVTALGALRADGGQEKTPLPAAAGSAPKPQKRNR
jgi:hypothetical protein